jgi:hypothetical protein
MDKEITILIVIDIPAALKENTLENNIYLIDDGKAAGSARSEGNGTARLTTAMNGFYWADGSQACGIILNWLLMDVGSTPLMLSHRYDKDQLLTITKPTGLNHLSLYLTNISGEAVEKGIIFPAQYGTPSNSTEGLYWSATVDTNKPGTYTYRLEFLLSTMKEGEEGSRSFTHKGRIKVTNEPKRNGFTHAGVGFLPIG